MPHRYGNALNTNINSSHTADVWYSLGTWRRLWVSL